MIYFYLFLAFVRIGFLAFGGGIAVLPLIQKEIVDTYQWLTTTQFLDLVTLSELTPGPIAINSATFVGYKVGGFFGAVIATGSFCLPSIGFIIFISKFLSLFEGNDHVQKIMKGLRPSVIALMSLAGFSIAQNGIMDWFAVILSVVSFILVWKKIIDPILMLILAGLAGI
ncbi:MAG: chromate transporter, partial [Candidatus Atribacteria bacterium]|nr:chromate transporter [Candidatus Atribacteria bacterium]